MLHIILVILKIIGILLAAAIGLLVLGVLLVIFVPLRYQLDFERGDEKNLVQGRFGWLARFILVTAKLEDNKAAVTVRICGITKQLAPTEKKAGNPYRKNKRVKKGRRGDKNKTDTGATNLPAQVLKQEKTCGQENTHGQDKAFGQENTHGQDKAFKQENTHGQDEAFKQEETCGQDKAFKDTADLENQESPGTKHASAGMLKKIKGIYFHIKSVVLKIYNILIRIPQIPLILMKKWRGVRNKADTVKKKIMYYLDLWKDEGTQAVFMLSKDQIRYLWKHLRPRKIKGKLRYGFEDPSVTGMVTGGLYLILPMSFYELELLPEFEPDKPLILEGKLLIKGHVRICHLAKSAWILFRNKNLRKLLKQLKAQTGLPQ